LVERNKLPRKLSLKGRARIARLFRTGRRLTGDYFICIWEKSDRFRYGLFIPAHVGNAVARNRVKRQLREAVRLCRQRLISPVCLGLIPRKNTGKISCELVKADVDRIIDRLNSATG